MKKGSTLKKALKQDKKLCVQLIIGLDLGDRNSRISSLGGAAIPFLS